MKRKKQILGVQIKDNSLSFYNLQSSNNKFVTDFDRTADKKIVWRRKSQFNICTTLEDHLSAQKERRICLVVSEEAALTTNTIFHTAITTKAAATTTSETKI